MDRLGDTWCSGVDVIAVVVGDDQGGVQTVIVADVVRRRRPARLGGCRHCPSPFVSASKRRTRAGDRNRPAEARVGALPRRNFVNAGDRAGRQPGSRRDRDAALPQRADQEERRAERSEEHTSELQSLMRISYAVFCLKKKNILTNYLPVLLLLHTQAL